MRKYTHPRYRWSAPYLIVLVLILLQTFSVGIIMLGQHGMGEHILLTHAREMMGRLADGAIYTTRHHLQSAENTARVTRGLIRSGILLPADTSSFEMYFLQTLRYNSAFSGLSYGDRQGRFLYVSREYSNHEDDAYLTKIIHFREGRRKEELLQRDSELALRVRKIINDDFDPRNRPWYAAFRQNKLLWTPPYIFYTSREPGITVSIPVVDAQDRVLGAFGVDLEIHSLSEFLARKKISEHSFSFIVTRQGELAAHSDMELVKKHDAQGRPQLVNVNELTDKPVLQYLWQTIRSLPEQELSQGATMDFTVAGVHYLAMVRSFPGNSQWPWLMSVVAPENDFVAIFRQARRRALLWAFLYAIGISLAIFFLIARFFRPMRRLLHYAHFDPLTELYNRRAFFEQSEKIITAGRAQGIPFCLAMVDVDDFKKVNDTHGHGVGDELLTAIAGRLRGSLSEQDLIARYGGEEFVVLLVDTDPGQGLVVCERLRRAMADAPIHTRAGMLRVTISIGLAPLDTSADVAQAINWADQALLQAKQEGKNRVVLAELPSD